LIFGLGKNIQPIAMVGAPQRRGRAAGEAPRSVQ